MRFNKTRRAYVWRNLFRMLFSSGKAHVRKIYEDDHAKLESAEQVLMEWPEAVAKPMVGLVRDRDKGPYWTKYERFLKNNEIPYGLLEIHQSNWQNEARKFDIIVWRPVSEPAELDEAAQKIYILENYLGKLCYPDYRSLLLYENKAMQYETMRALELPVVETFLSYSFPEIAEKILDLDYPLVHKVRTGSSSRGVEWVENPRQALQIAERAFSKTGRQTHWTYQPQKDYVYFQKYQPNNGTDIRINVCGPYVFGYYRDVPPGDFRASGMNTTRKEALPHDAMALGVEVCRKLGQTRLAVDMLRDPVDQRLHIIEISMFTYVKTPEQLHVDGIPGVYVMKENGSFEFRPGRYWLPEIVLREFLMTRWLPKN